MSDDLILVNAYNRAIGRADKRTVHAEGLLHRAFSIFLVDPEGQLLLQQRHPAKYHSGGLWANTCCGHPHPGEHTLLAARRRLGEEMGISVSLRFGFRTRYEVRFSNGLMENEIVYVYFGLAPLDVAPNPEEISAVHLRPLPVLESEIEKAPDHYSYWLKHYITHHFCEIDAGIARMLDRPLKPQAKLLAPKPRTPDRSLV